MRDSNREKLSIDEKNSTSIVNHAIKFNCVSHCRARVSNCFPRRAAIENFAWRIELAREVRSINKSMLEMEQ